MVHKLPVVAETVIDGIHCKVHACPFGLIRKMIQAKGNTLAELDVAAEIVCRCVETPSGEPIPVDDLDTDEVSRIVQLTTGKGGASDFSTPPVASGSGGAG